MNNQIKTIGIVGAGTAGLIAGLILKTRFPHFQIDIIASEDISTVGVGEGSTEHFKEFMEFVGISQYDLIRNTDATYKIGIMFKDWGTNDYLHSVQLPYNDKAAQYSYVYAKLIADKENPRTSSSEVYWQNLINLWFLNKEDQYPANQFHFNTEKLGNYLKTIAESKGINFINDEIKKVQTADNLNITSLTGVSSNYAYDFYIDCTGFKRLLINSLGAKYKSCSNVLKMNSAITFQTEDTENYNVWTVAKAMDAGWLFRIPVWGRYGNGYIFDDNYIDYETANLEVNNLFGKEIEIGKKFKFDPGYLDRPWIGNCCAMGLCGSFFEPLEATSIATTIQQSFLLMHKLINYDQNIVNDYNKSFENIMLNIRDFIALHYISNKKDSKFWKDLYMNPIMCGILEEKLHIWKNKLPISEDFSIYSDYALFKEDSFIMVMQGLDLFNSSSIRAEYESLPEVVKQDAENKLYDQQTFIERIKCISHKDFLRIIRSLY